MNYFWFGYGFFKINRLIIIAEIIINIDPVITGLIKYSKETPPIITIIGLPPAGGWVILKKIIKPTPKPTAIGIVI
jgi:hypothetical protein